MATNDMDIAAPVGNACQPLELRHRITAGRWPTSVYDLFVDGREVGFIQVHHKASHGPAFPPEAATHIGYGIDASERRKGYGTAILRLALPEARKIGLHEVFINADESNVASWKIIEANGGELVKVFRRLDNGEACRHYRIDLK